MKKIYLLQIFILITGAVIAQNTFPSSGNVGIGTASPAYDVDIASGANTTLRIGTTVNTGYSNLFLKGVGGPGSDIWKISKSPGGSGSMPSSNLEFIYNNGITSGDRSAMKLFWASPSFNIAINSDVKLFNNVTFGVNGSIGAQSLVLSANTNASNLFPFPTNNYILIADGKIGAREVVVSLSSPFPDYVFKPEYKLTSLTEIENYIKLNSHLPEMPSAEEVEKNGLEVSKTTTLLVQKIEELTLHMIEMNKKIERLEKENKQLQKK